MKADIYKKIIKRAGLACIIIILLFAVAGFIDYMRVRSFEKPIFAIAAVTADDGGSDLYKGIGYSVYIKGNFMPEDEFPGVV